jgi:hypothetical protein
MKFFQLLLGIMLVLIMAACQPTPEQIQKAIEQTQIAGKSVEVLQAEPTAIEEREATVTAEPTKSPAPTKTPEPTSTRRPTATKAPTLTPTPIPDPVTLEGSGDDVVDANLGFRIGTAHITYEGTGHFAVKNLDDNNEWIDLLVNDSGPYDGWLPIGFFDSEEQTERFEVNASGPWKIIVYPLSEVNMNHICDVPTVCTGKGDDIVFLRGSKPDKAHVTSVEKGHFAVKSISLSDYDLLVNDTGPYEGTVLLDPDTIVLIISAEGNWSIDISGR